jgi:hypothetical protein
MHAGMIRARLRGAKASRAITIGIAATLAVGAVLAARPANPAAADPPREALRRQRLDERAREASRALEAFAAALGAARDAARRGVVLVQAGDESPAPALQQAAALMEAAIPEAEAADAALTVVRGYAAAARAEVDLPAVATPAELRGIAGQLRDAAEAAGPVVERRRAAIATLEQLEAALAALDAEDPLTALEALAAARAERSELVNWEPPPVTLPLWLRTTARLIDAAEAIADAVIDGDAAAARRAARRYAAAAEDAQRADVSLALTLSEASDGLTATPMRRLGNALAAIEAARASVASLMLVRPAG